MDTVLRTLHTNRTAVNVFFVCTVAGAFFLIYRVLSLLRVLLDVYLTPGISLDKFGAGKGSWAVITGASDGIGKEFAFQLAKEKFNVLLVSRTKSKLDDLAQEIASKYRVETRVFPLDFITADDGKFKELASVIDSLQVGVLVNNVAVNYEMPTPFAETDDQLISNIINVNSLATLKVTKMVVPQMTSNKTGLIINLGSFAGSVATPYLSVYSATKAFLATFSQALGSELQGTGVVVQHVNTYFVVTAMSKVRRPSWAIPMPKPYVRSVLSRIGVPGGSDIPYGSTPYPSHALMDWAFTTLVPKWFLVKQNFDVQVDIRKRALRKREREAAQSKEQ